MRLHRLILLVIFLVTAIFTGCFDSDSDSNDPVGGDVVSDIWIWINYPAQWGTVTGIEEVRIEAGPAGEIDSVSLLIDGQAESVDSISPFAFSWDVNGLTGSHTIFARAFSDEEVADSDLLTVSVAVPPELSPIITSPANFSTVENTVTVLTEETTSTEVDSLTLYINGLRFDVDDSAPFQFQWTVPGSANSHTLFVKSWSGNQSGTSPLVTVFVEADSDSELPVVRITRPADWAVVQGQIEVIAEAHDNYGIDRVVLIVDGSEHATLSSAPYLFQLDTDLLTIENHTLICKVYDTSGNNNLSNMVTMVVDR